MDSKSKEIYEYIVRKEDHWCIISFLFILFGLFGAAYVHTIIILIICVITGGIILIPAIKSPFDAKKNYEQMFDHRELISEDILPQHFMTFKYVRTMKAVLHALIEHNSTK